MNENVFLPDPADKNAESYVVPEGVVAIGDGAFENWKKLRSIELPESVVFIGKKSFRDCKSLKTVNLPKNLKEIGEYVSVFQHSHKVFLKGNEIWVRR